MCIITPVAHMKRPAHLRYNQVLVFSFQIFSVLVRQNEPKDFNFKQSSKKKIISESGERRVLTLGSLCLPSVCGLQREANLINKILIIKKKKINESSYFLIFRTKL